MVRSYKGGGNDAFLMVAGVGLLIVIIYLLFQNNKPVTVRNIEKQRYFDIDPSISTNSNIHPRGIGPRELDHVRDRMPHYNIHPTGFGPQHPPGFGPHVRETW